MEAEKRYCTIEESIIESCKEINLMRKGLLPERTLDDLWAEFDKMEKESDEDKLTVKPKLKVVAQA